MHVLGYTYIIFMDTCMNSVIDYFNQYKNRFIIIYGVFLGLLILVMGYFFIVAFKRLKIVMWNTNIILKTIPKSALSKHDNEELKNFFINWKFIVIFNFLIN